MTVIRSDVLNLLAEQAPRSVNAIITSPPYAGLPGRADTLDLVSRLLRGAEFSLAENGSIALVVGATDECPHLPFEVAADIVDADTHRHGFFTRAMYVWDRTGTMTRRVRHHVVTHDYVIHVSRPDRDTPLLHNTSVIRTSQHGFNYGSGVTTPPDLAALLVNRLTGPDDLVVDPFCGLGEIGMQALNQGRRFLGGDIEQSYVRIANERLAELA